MSDDQKTKNEIITEIVSNGQGFYKQPESSPAKDLLSAYMTALCLQSK